MAPHATAGDRDVMVATGHGLCVILCEETTHKRSDLNNVNVPWRIVSKEVLV
jgi:hypothetical protein